MQQGDYARMERATTQAAMRRMYEALDAVVETIQQHHQGDHRPFQDLMIQCEMAMTSYLELTNPMMQGCGKP